jgi:hypothetical protein
VAGTINAKVLSATAAAADKVYDGGLNAAPTLAINAADLVSGESVTATASGSFNTKDVSTANLVTVASATLINGNGGLASDYSLAAGQTAVAHITPKTVSLSGSRLYDGTANVSAGVLTVGSLVGSETLTLSGSGTVASKNVGAGKAVTLGTLALGDGTGLASNYSFSRGMQTVDVTPASLTLSTSAISKTYDGSRSAVGTPVVIGGKLFAGDTLSGGSFAFADASVGSNKTVYVSGVAVDDGNGGANYAVTLASNTSSTIARSPVLIPAPVPVLPAPPGASVASVSPTTSGAPSSLGTASSSGAPGATDGSSSSDAPSSSGDASSAGATDATGGTSSADAASSSSAASSPSVSGSAGESAPAVKSGNSSGSSAAPKAASAAASKDGGKANAKATSKQASKAKDGDKADAQAAGKAAGKAEDARKADTKLASKADGKAKGDKKAADAARTARQAQARNSILAQAKLMAAARAAARLAGGTNAGVISAAMLGRVGASPGRGNLPLGSAGSNTLLIVPPLCDGACSPAEADAAVAVLAQAQAAGSVGAPADIMTESFHQLPWRSNSAAGNAARSRAVSEYSENLETVNFINMINLFMIP